MIIYTSYFARAARLPNAIAICRSLPSYYTGLKYTPLAPPWDLVKITDPALFAFEYTEQILNKLEPHAVLADLIALAACPILVCYEKPADFCHRQIVAEWLMKSTAYTIEELE